jgi:hypothetical protein
MFIWLRRKLLQSRHFPHEFLPWKFVAIFSLLLFFFGAFLVYSRVSSGWKTLPTSTHLVTIIATYLWRAGLIAWETVWFFKPAWFVCLVLTSLVKLYPDLPVVLYDTVALCASWLAQFFQKQPNSATTYPDSSTKTSSNKTQALFPVQVFPPLQPQQVQVPVTVRPEVQIKPLSVVPEQIHVAPPETVAFDHPLPTKQTISLMNYINFSSKPSLKPFALNALKRLMRKRGIQPTPCRDGTVDYVDVPSRDVLLQPREYYIRSDLCTFANDHKKSRRRKLKLGTDAAECVVLEHVVKGSTESTWLQAHCHMFEGSVAHRVYDGLDHDCPIVGRYAPHLLYVSEAMLAPLIKHGFLTENEVANLERRRIRISDAERPTFIKIVLEDNPLW